MQNKKEIVKELRATLNKLKYYQTSLEILTEPNLFKECLLALAYIGKNEVAELTNDVYSLLECPNEIIRGKAVSTLGFQSRLFLPEFREKAYNIWINDPSDSVKVTALSAWAGYFIESKNKDVISKLYKIITNETYSVSVRTQAYSGIFETITFQHPNYDGFADFSELLSCKNNKEFNSKANWNAVKEIMLEYAPEVLAQENKK